ncbi:hypothetical protein L6164_030807 [Bauhinia variegata]|uniref:Uncharacterized protein n=1 Tax=Bauhinia variegata TaxID=167791 RepID=A0ACB9LDG5_BAUVA|nr:hypothetical protein L6164_030807 [Bauhinia variegata]
MWEQDEQPTDVACEKLRKISLIWLLARQIVCWGPEMEGSSLRKGAWTVEEDNLLRSCIQKYGEGKWHLVPQRAGLNRCRKSCRLRWLNYLSPNIKRGCFTEDEVDMIIRFHSLLGNRWSLIAGRLPGRTANNVKNYWNTNLRHRISEKVNQLKEKSNVTMKTHEVIKTKPRIFPQNSPWLRGKLPMFTNDNEPIQPVFAKNYGVGECSSAAQSMFPNLGDSCLPDPSLPENWRGLLKRFLDEVMADNKGKSAHSPTGQNTKKAYVDDEELAGMMTGLGEGDYSLEEQGFWNDLLRLDDANEWNLNFPSD